MSSYSRNLILILLFAINIYANSKPLTTKQLYAHAKNDLYLLVALDAELNKSYKEAATLYEKLFENTHNNIYCQKAIVMYAINNNAQKVYNLTKNNYSYISQHQELLQEYAISAMMLKKYDEALEIANKLIKSYNTPKNYAIAGDIYYKMKNYKKAVEYYESSYASKQNISTLLPLVDILYSYVNQKQKAISYLETYYREKGCNIQICLRLVRYYQQSQNTDGVISILKTMYNKYKMVYNKQQLTFINNMLVDYLEKKDINQAIKFLEDNHIDNKKLLSLYEQKGDITKALNLVRKEYKKTKDKALLGQIAMLEFELAPDKIKVMKHVIANFELALKADPNPRYQNYYGYLLIDYDIDVKKGLELVKKALKQYPTNLAYMDSVAWGYYKTHQCQKAFEYMSKVIKEIGLDEEETAYHWDKINNCNMENK